MMNRRERLRRCYFYEELDRPAVYSRAGFPSGDSTYDELKAYLAAHTELKGGWSGRQFESPLSIESRTEPYSADFERRIETLHTPAGDLTRTTLVSLKGQPGMHETFLLKGPEDAAKYLSLPLPELAGEVASFFEVDRAVGDAGIVEVGLGFNPAGFVAELFGSEMFAILTVTDRDLVHALCERQMRVILASLSFVLSRGVGPYFGMLGEEYLVPPLHSPVDFADFNVRYDKPIIDKVHEAGGRFHVHSHGSMTGVLQGFVDMGVDVLHPFEPPPQGDITPAQAKAVARGRMCLEGNTQIHRMYEPDPDGIRAEIEALIRDAFDDGRGLIVCPTASPYIRGHGRECFPQYKAMIDTVLAATR